MSRLLQFAAIGWEWDEGDAAQLRMVAGTGPGPSLPYLPDPGALAMEAEGLGLATFTEVLEMGRQELSLQLVKFAYNLASLLDLCMLGQAVRSPHQLSGLVGPL